MRLIETNTLSLHEFYGDNIPPYAILSHTWGDEEVTFKDWENLAQARRKAGFSKIRCACAKALEHGFDWLWVDTNCIDKSSSAELSEAINSMFDWYARSGICYAYLGDVPSAGAADGLIAASRWFTRGWTLQELVAPKHVWFYAADWTKMGTRNGALANLVSHVTGIDQEFLKGDRPVQRACIAQKMSWLSKRTTTRTEDTAYCMLGLFEINMPLLYGEGAKAFTRLQHEIIRASNDHTIFCWTWTPSVPDTWTSLLAPSPSQFAGAGIFRPNEHISVADEVSVYSMTNAGLSIQLPVIYAAASYFVVLQAAPIDRSCDYPMLSCLQVRGQPWGAVLYVARCPFPQQPVTVAARTTPHVQRQPLLVMNNRAGGRAAMLDMITLAPAAAFDYPGDFTVVVVLDTHDPWMRRRLNGAGSYPYGAFDNILSTLRLGVTGRRAKYEVGAAWINMDTGESEKGVCIFVAVEISRGTPRWFCQIFALEDGVRGDSFTILESLKKQVRRTLDEQPGHYSETLDLSVVMDNIHPLQKDRHNSFLRIVEGRTTYLDKDTAQEDDVEEDSSSTAGSIDSHVAITSGQKTREWSLPAQGAFRVPEWEE